MAAGGALLVIAGMTGYFYSSAFGSPGRSAAILGAFETNGWENLLHIATGALALMALQARQRGYALALGGAGYLALAIWGIASGDRHALAGVLARGTGTDVLHLVVGAFALAALAARLRRPSS